MGLATTRERALDNRRKIDQGIAPRITENPAPTLADALEAVIEGRSASWKNGGRSAEIWRNSVRNHADNLIHRPVDQIEIEGDIWTIPGQRTKVGREFRVPLSPEALTVLDEARPYSDNAPD